MGLTEFVIAVFVWNIVLYVINPIPYTTMELKYGKGFEYKDMVRWDRFKLSVWYVSAISLIPCIVAMLIVLIAEKVPV
jgi:succinate dehydrogenase/fumarate reductase cytochrome b subunit